MGFSIDKTHVIVVTPNLKDQLSTKKLQRRNILHCCIKLNKKWASVENSLQKTRN